MASESSCVYIPGNCQKFPKGILLSKQIAGICFFYSVCHEKRSLNQMCFLIFLLHSLLLYIQTYSVVRLHLSDTRLAGLPVGSGNPALSVTVSFLWWKIQPPAIAGNLTATVPVCHSLREPLLLKILSHPLRKCHYPRATSQADKLAYPFGDCRVSQMLCI